MCWICYTGQKRVRGIFLCITPRNGVNVRGYIHWSRADNWEWASGFVLRSRLYYTDYKDNLKCIPKASAKWYKAFLQDNQ
ncbi:hypothetical protein NL676_039596 [Syzygium grande]|nr:hypothetical protein NL676_039596 [Syzygium grande]